MTFKENYRREMDAVSLPAEASDALASKLTQNRKPAVRKRLYACGRIAVAAAALLIVLRVGLLRGSTAASKSAAVPAEAAAAAYAEEVPVTESFSITASGAAFETDIAAEKPYAAPRGAAEEEVAAASPAESFLLADTSENGIAAEPAPLPEEKASALSEPETGLPEYEALASGRSLSESVLLQDTLVCVFSGPEDGALLIAAYDFSDPDNPRLIGSLSREGRYLGTESGETGLTVLVENPDGTVLRLDAEKAFAGEVQP